MQRCNEILGLKDKAWLILVTQKDAFKPSASKLRALRGLLLSEFKVVLKHQQDLSTANSPSIRSFRLQ